MSVFFTTSLRQWQEEGGQRVKEEWYDISKERKWRLWQWLYQQKLPLILFGGCGWWYEWITATQLRQNILLRRMTWSIPFLQTYVGAEQPTRPSRDPTHKIWWKKIHHKSKLLVGVAPLSLPGCWQPWLKDRHLEEWQSQTPCKLLAPEHVHHCITSTWRTEYTMCNTYSIKSLSCGWFEINLNDKLVVDIVPW